MAGSSTDDSDFKKDIGYESLQGFKTETKLDRELILGIIPRRIKRIIAGGNTVPSATIEVKARDSGVNNLS